MATLYKLSDDMFSNDFSLIVNRCKDCGLVFLDSGIFDHLKDIHEEYWARSDNEHVEKDVTWILEEVSRYRTHGRILEIGAGKGDLLLELKNNNFEVVGVEISKTAALEAQKKGLTVLNNEVELVDFPQGSFDYVIMYGVIEHLRDPYGSLSKIRGWLRPGGGLMVYTPNIDSIFHLAARLLHVITFHQSSFFLKRVFVAMHTFYFNPRTLSSMLRSVGFRIDRTLYSNIDMEIVYKYNRDRRWAASMIFRKLVDIVILFSEILNRQSHFMVIANSNEDTPTK